MKLLKTLDRTSDQKIMVISEGAVMIHLQELRRRNLRVQTIYNRQRCLTRLAEWAGGPILYLDEVTLTRWQDQRVDEISPAARATELSNVREFYRWALRHGLVVTDPTVRLDMPRAPRRVPRPIGDASLAIVLEGADDRMSVIFGLAAFEGLRACEIARLDWADIGLGDTPPMLRVVDGKGGHGRVVPLSPLMVEILQRLDHRHGPVIRRISGGHGHYKPHDISALANRYLHANGVPESLHQLRHRFGTATYRACRDIRAVQELLGHASPTTTAVYAAPSPTTALEAVLAASTFAA